MTAILHSRTPGAIRLGFVAPTRPSCRVHIVPSLLRTRTRAKETYSPAHPGEICSRRIRDRLSGGANCNAAIISDSLQASTSFFTKTAPQADQGPGVGQEGGGNLEHRILNSQCPRSGCTSRTGDCHRGLRLPIIARRRARESRAEMERPYEQAVPKVRQQVLPVFLL